MLKPAATVLLIIAAATPCTTLRSSQPIKNREFSKDSVSWKNVDVPHDWAIYGPFSRDNDLQKVTVEQNGETEATWKTGREKYSSKQGQRDSLPHASLSPQSKGVCEFKSC